MLCRNSLRFSAAEAFPDRGLITVKNPKDNDREPPKNFSFDAVFGQDVLQKDIYNTCAASVVESVLGGYNGTIFAYGQVCDLLMRHSECYHYVRLELVKPTPWRADPTHQSFAESFPILFPTSSILFPMRSMFNFWFVHLISKFITKRFEVMITISSYLFHDGICSRFAFQRSEEQARTERKH